MSARMALIGSLAGNVVLASLATYLVMRPPEPAPPSARETLLAAVERAPRTAASGAAGGGAGLSLGVFEEKVVALARMEAEVAGSRPAPDFWSADMDDQIRHQAEALESQRERIRTMLFDRYGAGAADDPVFARVFKPLNMRYPYLSSKSQIGLLKLQQARGPVSRSRPQLVGPGAAPPDFGADAEQRRLDFERSVRGLLSAGEYTEYQLRESRVARQLRAAGVAADEKEFRALYDVLQANAESRTPAGHVAEQDRLLAILGPERFAKFSSTHDPAFAAMEAAGARHKLTPEQIMNVYSVMLTANQSLARRSLDPAARDQPPPPREQRVTVKRDVEVARMVGDAAAADLVQEYIKQTMSIDPRPRASL